MQRELARDVAPFAGRDHLAMGEAHRMQRSLDLALPELDEAEKLRMIGRDIVILSEIAVEHVAVIGHPVEEFRRGQPVAFQQEFGFRDLHFSAPVIA